MPFPISRSGHCDAVKKVKTMYTIEYAMPMVVHGKHKKETNDVIADHFLHDEFYIFPKP